MLVLYVLQNAYTSERHPFENEEGWSRELKRSHTGRMLKKMIPHDVEHVVINASQKIGNSPDSCFKADPAYISEQISTYEPDVICACGKIAQEGCRRLGVEFVSAPHPACRSLSKERAEEIRKEIMNAVSYN